MFYIPLHGTGHTVGHVPPLPQGPTAGRGDLLPPVLGQDGVLPRPAHLPNPSSSHDLGQEPMASPQLNNGGHTPLHPGPSWSVVSAPACV